MFQDFIQVSKATTQGIKTITKLATICEIMNSSDLGKSMFTDVHKLLTIYLTVCHCLELFKVNNDSEETQ